MSKCCRQESLKIEIVDELYMQSYLPFAKHAFKELRKLFPSSAS